MVRLFIYLSVNHTFVFLFICQPEFGPFVCHYAALSFSVGLSCFVECIQTDFAIKWSTFCKCHLCLLMCWCDRIYSPFIGIHSSIHPFIHLFVHSHAILFIHSIRKVDALQAWILFQQLSSELTNSMNFGATSCHRFQSMCYLYILLFIIGILPTFYQT